MSGSAVSPDPGRRPSKPISSDDMSEVSEGPSKTCEGGKHPDGQPVEAEITPLPPSQPPPQGRFMRRHAQRSKLTDVKEDPREQNEAENLNSTTPPYEVPSIIITQVRTPRPSPQPPRRSSVTSADDRQRKCGTSEIELEEVKSRNRPPATEVNIDWLDQLGYGLASKGVGRRRQPSPRPKAIPGPRTKLPRLKLGNALNCTTAGNNERNKKAGLVTSDHQNSNLAFSGTSPNPMKSNVGRPDPVGNLPPDTFRDDKRLLATILAQDREKATKSSSYPRGLPPIPPIARSLSGSVPNLSSGYDPLAKDARQRLRCDPHSQQIDSNSLGNTGTNSRSLGDLRGLSTAQPNDEKLMPGTDQPPNQESQLAWKRRNDAGAEQSPAKPTAMNSPNQLPPICR